MISQSKGEMPFSSASVVSATITKLKSPDVEYPASFPTLAPLPILTLPVRSPKVKNSAEVASVVKSMYSTSGSDVSPSDVKPVPPRGARAGSLLPLAYK